MTSLLPSPTQKTPEVVINAEIDFLLCCTHIHIDSAAAEKIRTLSQQDIDWGYLIQIGTYHKVLPLLYHSLKTICPEAVPKDVLDLLKFHFQVNLLRNKVLSKELFRVLELLAKHSIPAIPYKGLELTALAYANLALRQFNDIDILIRKEDTLKAKKILPFQGYKLALDLAWEHHFVHQKTQVTIDLHQSIVPKIFCLDLDFDYLWKQLRPLYINSKPLSSLPPDDLLLILCILVGKDCYHKKLCLIQLCDIAELLQAHPRIDWARLLQKSRTLGCERMLLLSLFLVGDLLRISLPKAISEQISKALISKYLAMQVRTQMWSEFTQETGPDGDGFWQSLWSHNHYFYLGMREQPTAKLIYCHYWLRQCFDKTLILAGLRASTRMRR